MKELSIKVFILIVLFTTFTVRARVVVPSLRGGNLLEININKIKSYNLPPSFNCEGYRERYNLIFLDPNMSDFRRKEALKEFRDNFVRDTQSLKDAVQYLSVNGGSFSNQTELNIVLQSGNRKIERLETLINSRKLCQFQMDIQSGISNTLNDSNKFFLRNLESIGTCILSSSGQGRVDNTLKAVAKNSLDAINQHFSDKASQGSLSEADCNVLRRAYQLWGGFYDQENADQLNTELEEDQIPLYNVNSHDSSYQFWMREKGRGTIPENGLPLMHVDTHTDLGHVHNQIRDETFGAIRFDELSPLILLAENNNRAQLITQMESLIAQPLAGSTGPRLTSEDARNLIDWFRNSDIDEIKSKLYDLNRKAVHHIAQPLVGAAVSNITSDLVMVMPAWTTRISHTSRQDSNGNFIPCQTHLVNERNGFVIGMSDDEARNCPELNSRDSPIYPYSQSTYDRVKIRPTTIAVANINAENQQDYQSDQTGESYKIDQQTAATQLPDYSRYLPERAKTDGFILDIDLDAFVSEGHSTTIEPISFERTVRHRENNPSSPSEHKSMTEMDSTVEVSLKEMNLIKARIDSFFNRLERAKERGVLPKVITIADSTVLSRLMTSRELNTQDGGNFTPSCLAFLVNYMVRSKLRSLYNITPEN